MNDAAREPTAPLYALCDRRVSGEARTIAEFGDFTAAQAALAVMQAQGSDCWLELIPQRLIP